MANILFSSKAVQHLSKHSVRPEDLNKEALRNFLVNATDFFRIIEKLIAQEKVNSSSKGQCALSVAQILARTSHRTFKKGLPHIDDVNKLFGVAQEAEQVLHMLTEMATEQLGEFREPFRTCFERELQHLEQRITDQCHRALERMNSSATANIN